MDYQTLTGKRRGSREREREREREEERERERGKGGRGGKELRERKVWITGFQSLYYEALD